MANHSMDTTKVQLGKPMNFTWIAYGNMDEELLTGAEMTEMAVLPKPTIAWGITHKTGNLQHTTQSTGSSTSWRLSLPGASTGLNLFQVVGLGLVFFAAWSL